MRRFEWTDQAKGELRKVPRDQGMQILVALSRYSESGQGDIKQLKISDQFRLRVGNYRVRFKVLEDGVLKIVHVLDRKDAYRK